MFDRIAGRYDLMNSVMTAGLHHRWRSRTVDHVSGGLLFFYKKQDPAPET
jgi:ubiquinone/menaquinone biosynthesis C-methylase UbiE